VLTALARPGNAPDRRAGSFLLAILAMSIGEALAHNVTPGDAGYIQEIWGVNLIPSPIWAPSTW
jgi:hypothetical protein